MTKGEHIRQLFGGFKITLSDAALMEIACGGIDMDSEFTPADHDSVMYAVLRFAPILMLSPSSWSVSENGHSRSSGFNMDGFLKWYSLMCKRYGVSDELNTEKPRIRFL